MTGHPLEALSALLDGELPEQQRRDVEAHLAGCASCARHLAELRALDTLARGLPPVAVPDGYLEALPGRVRARIRADRPASAARAPWVWPLAAGLALAVLAPLVLRDGPGPERRAAQEYDAPGSAPAPSTVPEATVPDKPEPAPQAEPDRSSSAPTLRRAATPEAKARRDAPQRQVIGGLAQEPSAKVASSRERETAVAEDRAAEAREMRDEAPQTSTFAREPDAAVATPPPPPPPAAPPVAAIGGRGMVRKSEAGNAIPLTDEERAFAAASRLPTATAGAARRARAAWLRFLADHPSGARSDEGRVRLVEASVSLFRATGDEDDRRAAERDAAAYLSSPGAPQAARVRDALRRLAEPR
jgi:hypothetical protein